MKKTLKIILISLGFLFGIIIILIIWFSIRYSTLTGRMNPIENSNINDTVYAIKDRYVNAYLFETGGQYVIFDACISEKKVDEALGLLGIEADKVAALFLTHSDGDHIGATGMFVNAAIYMHKEEEQMVNGQTARMGPKKYRWEFGNYNLLQDRQLIEVGELRIEVLHTPGHTPGSVCYIINDDYLVTGDNLIYADGKYEKFLEVVNMDTEMQIESLKVLPPPASFKYILTSHHGVHRIE